MKTYDIYGLKGDNLEEHLPVIERAIGAKFAAHESSYMGGDYYRLGKVGEESFKLVRNYDSFEQEWFEEDFKDADALLYVNATDRPDEWEQRLSNEVEGITLLKRQQA